MTHKKFKTFDDLLDFLLNIFGISYIAEQCGVTKQAVYFWRRMKKIPYKQVYVIEKMIKDHSVNGVNKSDLLERY